MQSESTEKNKINLQEESAFSAANVIDFLQTIAIALTIVIFLYLFILVPNDVRGDSMRETLHNGELLLTNKFLQIAGGKQGLLYSLAGDYQRKDIVVFHLDSNNEDLVKRVIAIEGDKVIIKDGEVYLNGEKINEPYLADGSIDGSINNKGKTYTKDPSMLKEGEELTVPANKYFVMGDNRENSLDSRFKQVGLVDRTQMKGKVFLRYVPITRFGIIQ